MKKLVASLLAAGAAWAFSAWLHEPVSAIAHGEAAYGDMDGTTSARNSDEYSSTSSITYLGQYLDASVAPASAPGLLTTQGPACKVVRRGAKTNGYDSVDTDLPRGNAGYCAWHSWGSCGAKPLEFGVFFNLNGDPSCNPGSPAIHKCSPPWPTSLVTSCPVPQRVPSVTAERTL